MRVAHVSSSARLDGGAELCLMSLLKYELDHCITPFVLLPTHGEMELALKKLHVEYEILPYFSWRHRSDENALQSLLAYAVKKIINLITEQKIKKLFAAKNIDLVHINTTAVYSGQLAANRLKIPCIWHVREFNNNQSGYNFYNDACARKALSAATKCIAVSETISSSYKEFAPKADFVTIYDSMEIPEQKRERKIFTSCNVQIALIGNKKSAKGQIDAVMALSHLKNAGISDLNLILVGKEVDDNYCKQIKSFVKDNLLEDQVRYFDFCNDPNTILSHTDIALNCSRSESFGRTTVEAMMMNCLVIGNDNTCTHELLKDGRGLLYKNPKDLADKIKWALQNKGAAEHIARKGNQFAINSFNSGNTKIVELFNGICAQKLFLKPDKSSEINNI